MRNLLQRNLESRLQCWVAHGSWLYLGRPPLICKHDQTHLIMCKMFAGSLTITFDALLHCSDFWASSSPLSELFSRTMSIPSSLIEHETRWYRMFFKSYMTCAEPITLFHPTHRFFGQQKVIHYILHIHPSQCFHAGLVNRAYKQPLKVGFTWSLASTSSYLRGKFSVSHNQFASIRRKNSRISSGYEPRSSKPVRLADVGKRPSSKGSQRPSRNPRWVLNDLNLSQFTNILGECCEVLHCWCLKYKPCFLNDNTRPFN